MLVGGKLEGLGLRQHPSGARGEIGEGAALRRLAHLPAELRERQLGGEEVLAIEAQRDRQAHRAVGRVGSADRRPDLRGEIQRRLALELVEIRDRTSVRALVDDGPARQPDRVDELELAVGNPQHVRQLGGRELAQRQHAGGQAQALGRLRHESLAGARRLLRHPGLGRSDGALQLRAVDVEGKGSQHHRRNDADQRQYGENLAAKLHRARPPRGLRA